MSTGNLVCLTKSSHQQHDEIFTCLERGGGGGGVTWHMSSTLQLL